MSRNTLICLVVLLWFVNTMNCPAQQTVCTGSHANTLQQLAELGNLYGQLRYFYPSRITENKWQLWLANEVYQILNPNQPDSMPPLKRLETLGIKAIPAHQATSPPVHKKMWQHTGCGVCLPLYWEKKIVQLLYSIFGPYKSRIVKAAQPYSIPAAYKGHTYMFAHCSPQQKTAVSCPPSAQLNSICGAIISANAIKYFYAYPDYIIQPFDTLLYQSLSDALDDSTSYDTYLTLSRLATGINDGHARIAGKGFKYWYRPNAPVAYVGSGLLLVKDIVTPGYTIPRGSQLVSVDGVNAMEMFNRYVNLTSSPSQRYKYKIAAFRVLDGTQGSVCRLVFKPAGADTLAVTLSRDSMFYDTPYDDGPGYYLKDSILIVDLQLTNESTVLKIMRKDGYRGIIFDLRHSSNVSPLFLTHLSSTPIRFLTTTLNKVNYTGSYAATDTSFMVFNPRKPYIKVPVAFLCTADQISADETYLAAVKQNKLGIIVGDTTAGTNGNVVNVALPDGYTLMFTGMRVLNSDGSCFHGTGVVPDVWVPRTVAGFTANRDEILEQAMAEIKRRCK